MSNASSVHIIIKLKHLHPTITLASLDQMHMIINTKATLASLHAGVGETDLKSILSVMNSPPMGRATFKARERETGKAVESVAKVSCEEVIRKERLQSISSGAGPDENNLVSVHIFVLLPRSVNHTAYYSLATVLDIHLSYNRSNLMKNFTDTPHVNLFRPNLK